MRGISRIVESVAPMFRLKTLPSGVFTQAARMGSVVEGLYRYSYTLPSARICFAILPLEYSLRRSTRGGTFAFGAALKVSRCCVLSHV